MLADPLMGCVFAKLVQAECSFTGDPFLLCVCMLTSSLIPRPLHGGGEGFSAVG